MDDESKEEEKQRRRINRRGNRTIIILVIKVIEWFSEKIDSKNIKTPGIFIAGLIIFNFSLFCNYLIAFGMIRCFQGCIFLSKHINFPFKSAHFGRTLFF